MHLPRDLVQAVARHVSLRRGLALGVEVSRLEFRLHDLPASLDGFTIAQVSDLHVGEGAWMPVYASEAARMVHRADPDAVVNTGDFLQAEPPLGELADVVRQFLPAPKGDSASSLAILGNHDYFAGEEIVTALEARLESLGIVVLVNRAMCVAQHRGGISFIGLTQDAPGFDQGVEALLAAAHPRIALIHEPDLVERLPPGSADLVLAGHTHGGQIAIPGMKRVIVRLFCGSRYVEGLYHVNGMPMYVNRGIGSTGLPLRFRAGPEVTIIRLVH